MKKTGIHNRLHTQTRRESEAEVNSEMAYLNGVKAQAQARR